MTATPKKSDETRQRILEAALDLFRENGFDSTTMRDIAKQAGVALGAAYYYFDSKDALVMSFYVRAQDELRPRIESALSRTTSLEDRLRAVIDGTLEYFAPNRRLLRTLSSHIDPSHALSPFGDNTRDIRDRDLVFFTEVLAGSRVKVTDDLKAHLPRLLWLYQMGLLLFWLYDSSPQQRRTQQLIDKTLAIVVRLIKLSTLPLMRPIRKLVTDLMEIVYADEPPPEAAS
jgi:AcrR family transcriptional regulator